MSFCGALQRSPQASSEHTDSTKVNVTSMFNVCSLDPCSRNFIVDGKKCVILPENVVIIGYKVAGIQNIDTES